MNNDELVVDSIHPTWLILFGVDDGNTWERVMVAGQMRYRLRGPWAAKLRALIGLPMPEARYESKDETWRDRPSML